MYNDYNNYIKYYGKINYWNIYKITDLSELFLDFKSEKKYYRLPFISLKTQNFNEDISLWNVSNVINMKGCKSKYFFVFIIIKYIISQIFYK